MYSPTASDSHRPSARHPARVSGALRSAQPIVVALVSGLGLFACTGSCAGGSSAEPAPSAELALGEAAALDEAQPGSGEGSDEGSAEAAIEPEPPEPSCELGTPDGSGGCIVTPDDRRNAMTPDARWAHVMHSCPDPELGSFASDWVWAPHDAEQVLAELDVAGEGTTFDLLSDFEGTSIIIRVRDAATRDKLAVIKTTTSNTRVEAEVYAHRLSTFLGFGELVADVHHVALSGGALDKLEALLNGIRYSDEGKESRRLRVIRQVRAARQADSAFMGAMKPWLRAFIFHSGLGHRESLATSDVMTYLRARGPQPTDEEVRLRQYTRLYEPLGTHQGTIAMWQLAEDLSNIMLLDALTGQNDRFPGGNVHFMSVAGEEVEIGERRGRPIYEMGEVRLLALDNGAALHDQIGSGIRDLRGDIVGGTRVERFERETLEHLDALGRRLLARGCESPPFDDEVEAIWTYLGLAAADDRALALGYLTRLFEYLDELRRRGEPVLEPRLTVHDGSGDGSGEGSGAEHAGPVRSIDGEEPMPDEIEDAVVGVEDGSAPTP